MSGAILTLAVLEVVGRLQLVGSAWPSLTSVATEAFRPEVFALLTSATRTTIIEAGVGLLMGGMIGLTLAALSVLVPKLDNGTERFAALANAVPIVVLGPLLAITVGPGLAPCITAAVGAGFAVFIAVGSGLRSARPEHMDMVEVFGATQFKAFIEVRLPSSLTLVLDGLALAVAAAVMGALTGEWFGAYAGLGVVIINAAQNVQIELLWAAALTCTLLVSAAQIVLSLARFVIVRRMT